MIQDIYNSLLGNFIGYDRLYSLTKPALYGDRSEAVEVNLFIDLNSFFKRIWDPRGYSFKAENVLTASVINACAHYRNYFWTRHMIKSRIFLVWGENLPSWQPSSYNAHYRAKVAATSNINESDKLLEYNLKSLEFLGPYLPQIYFINGNENEVSAAIYALASNETIPNIILTKDIYAYQLVAYCPNTFIYRPKKRYTDNGIIDDSWVVMKRNLFRAMKHEMGYKITADQPNDARHLEYVLALAGLRDRHIKGIMTFNRACSTVMAMEEDRPDFIQDIEHFAYSLLIDTPTRCKGIGFSSVEDLIERRNSTSLLYAVDMMKNSPKFIGMMNGIHDLYNPQAVMDISNQEFTEYPLELMEL